MSALISSIARLFPTGRHLALLGFCAPQIWMYLVVQQLGVHASLGFHCASGTTLLIAAIAFYLRPTADIARWARPISVASMALFPVYLLLFPGNDVAHLLFAIVGGVGCAWSFLSWFKICCNTGQQDSICYLLLSFALAALCRLVLALIPIPVAYALVAAMSLALVRVEPAAERLSLETGSFRPPARPAPSPTAGNGRQKAFILLELALYSFVLGALVDSSSESQGLTVAMVLNYVLRIVFMLILFAWFTMRDRRRSVAHAAQVVMCCLVAAVLALVLLTDKTSLAVAALISFGRSIVLMLLTLVCAEIALSQRLHPFAVFGVGRAVYEFAVVGGSLFSKLVLQGGQLVTVSLNLLFFIVGCFMLVVANRTIRTIETIDDTDADVAPLPGDVAVSPAHCRTVAQRFGLTDRETEVFVLLCQGRGKAFVAEALSISENTVRHHCKNIYAKCGVHTREELMDLGAR